MGTALQFTPATKHIFARAMTVEQNMRQTNWSYTRRKEVQNESLVEQGRREVLKEEEILQRVQRSIVEQCNSTERRLSEEGIRSAEDMTERVYLQLARRLQMEKERLGR